MSSKEGPSSMSHQETLDTVVIGGGQAGLAAGYWLARQGGSFVILDDNARTGDSWRRRWDSLRLFTPSQFDSLPGLPFRSPPNDYPAKDEVAAYLEDYADHFKLPVKHNIRVTELSSDGQGYRVTADGATFIAQHVIVAAGPYQKPHVPVVAKQTPPDLFQLHSSSYRNPAQIPVGALLVVGAGNSGAEIALELARVGKRVWLAGRDVGRIPTNTPLGRVLGKPFDGQLVWWMMTHLLTLNTPIGRRMQASLVQHGAPLGSLRRQELAQAGVVLAPRLAGFRAGRAVLEDGSVVDADGVIWATGFEPDFGWIDLPIFDAQGFPDHVRGAARSAPGLYFLGLVFQTGLSSSLLGGVGRDAAHLLRQISLDGH